MKLLSVMFWWPCGARAETQVTACKAHASAHWIISLSTLEVLFKYSFNKVPFLKMPWSIQSNTCVYFPFTLFWVFCYCFFLFPRCLKIWRNPRTASGRQFTFSVHTHCFSVSPVSQLNRWFRYHMPGISSKLPQSQPCSARDGPVKE